MFTIIPLTIHPHQSIHDFSPIIFISSWKSEHILILKLQYMNSVVTVYHTETGDLVIQHYKIKFQLSDNGINIENLGQVGTHVPMKQCDT